MPAEEKVEVVGDEERGEVQVEARTREQVEVEVEVEMQEKV